MVNSKTNKVFGFIGIGINVLLVFRTVYLLYCYNFTSRLFLITYSNNKLLMWLLLENIGIYISILLCKEKIRFKLGAILILLIWILIFL
jgi:hypothetical protein